MKLHIEGREFNTTLFEGPFSITACEAYLIEGASNPVPAIRIASLNGAVTIRGDQKLKAEAGRF